MSARIRTDPAAEATAEAGVADPAGVAGLRVAIVNWRDPWHPAAGGAEVYAWELASRLAGRGAAVTYLTSRPRGHRRRAAGEGVAIVRGGGRFTVYAFVLAWLFLHRRRFDVVVDCQNGIPFFSPWVVRVPVFCVIFHVHDEQFDLYFPPLLARFGRWLEGPVACRTYRGHTCVAISPSTGRALRERLRWTGPIAFVPVGVAPVPVGRTRRDRGASGTAGKARRNGGQSLVCVSRLVPHKRVAMLVDAVGRLRGELPGLRLDVVGDGPELEPVRAAAAPLGGAVTVRGYVSEEEKRDLLAAADLHVSGSRGEGWGLSVMEAAALGVPTVAFDVDGLRDAVRDGETGWLVRDGQRLEDVLRAALGELADDGRRAELDAACRAWAARFDWAVSTDAMASLLTGHGHEAAWPH